MAQVKKVPLQYDKSGTVEKIAVELIPKYHTHLVNAKIGYLFRNKPIKKGGKIVLATAEKCSTKSRYLTGYDFLLVVNYENWNNLTDKQKYAVIDHELCHMHIDDDETGESEDPKYSIIAHDCDEFYAVISRHGLVMDDLKVLGTVVAKSQKVDE